MPKPKKFYAAINDGIPVFFDDWESCKEHLKTNKSDRHKSFRSVSEFEAWFEKFATKDVSLPSNTDTDVQLSGLTGSSRGHAASEGKPRTEEIVTSRFWKTESSPICQDAEGGESVPASHAPKPAQLTVLYVEPLSILDGKEGQINLEKDQIEAVFPDLASASSNVPLPMLDRFNEERLFEIQIEDLPRRYSLVELPNSQPASSDPPLVQLFQLNPGDLVAICRNASGQHVFECDSAAFSFPELREGFTRTLGREPGGNLGEETVARKLASPCAAAPTRVQETQACRPVPSKVDSGERSQQRLDSLLKALPRGGGDRQPGGLSVDEHSKDRSKSRSRSRSRPRDSAERGDSPEGPGRCMGSRGRSPPRGRSRGRSPPRGGSSQGCSPARGAGQSGGETNQFPDQGGLRENFCPSASPGVFVPQGNLDALDDAELDKYQQSLEERLRLKLNEKGRDAKIANIRELEIKLQEIG